MKYLFTLLTLILCGVTATAQQSTQYSMYMLNQFAQNPAYAGMDNSLSVTGVFRKQWVDLPGSPTYQNANAHLPLYAASGGIGINFENDAIGAEASTLVTLAYNYQLNIGRVGILSVGVAGGMFQKELNGAILRTPEGNYEGVLVDHRDDILPNTLETGQSPVFEAGVFFQGERLEIGLSAKNLVEPTVNLSENLDLQLVRTYFATIGYRIDVGDALALRPSVMVRTDAIQTQMDFSLLAYINENIFVGGSYRGYSVTTTDAVAIIAGLKISEQLNFAYAYDLTLSSLNSVSNGTHEIMLNYNFGKPIGQGKLPPIIYNPRF
ncbi:MAG: type IX secretion system membrane protein PorP/SprF [Saprospiraceae bacterium]